MAYEDYEKLVDLLIRAEKYCYERCGDHCGFCPYEDEDHCQERLKADYICDYVDIVNQ